MNQGDSGRPGSAQRQWDRIVWKPRSQKTPLEEDSCPSRAGGKSGLVGEAFFEAIKRGRLGCLGLILFGEEVGVVQDEGCDCAVSAKSRVRRHGELLIICFEGVDQGRSSAWRFVRREQGGLSVTQLLPSDCPKKMPTTCELSKYT